MTPAFNYNLNLEREDEEEEKEGIYAREDLHQPEPLVVIFESLSAIEIQGGPQPAEILTYGLCPTYFD